MSNPNPAWTDERLATAQRLWASGLPGSVIAAQIGGGFTRNAVIGMARKKGWGAHPRAKPPTFRPTRTRARSDAINHTKAMRAIAPPPLPRETPAPSAKTHVTFLERRGGQCKWIIGEPNGPDSICCGARRESGSVYCEHHSRLAYRPAQRRV